MSQPPHTAIIPQPANNTTEDTTIDLPDDVLRLIVTFVDFKGLPALACACRTTRDAARDEDMLLRDKTYVLRCWLAMGGKEDTLRRRYKDKEEGVWKMRDEPSDNLSEWLWVKVEGGRVRELYWLKEWIGEPLTGTIPAEIGALDGLTGLFLDENQICGHLPSEIGRLTSLIGLGLYCNRLEGPLPAELGALTALTHLSLSENKFTGKIPFTLVNLTNVETLGLDGNNFDTAPTEVLGTKDEIQKYLTTLRPSRPPAPPPSPPTTMSAKRSSDDEAEAPHTPFPQLDQTTLVFSFSTNLILPDDVWSEIVPFVDFKGLPALACACKATRDAARDEDMLARDKVYVLRCWLALDRWHWKDKLRKKYYDGGWKMRDEPSDVMSEWLGVTVEGGRVTKLNWGELDLTGTIPAEIGALDGLTYLDLCQSFSFSSSKIDGTLPLEIGRLTSLKVLYLNNNRLKGPLPAELGALTALTKLWLDNNNFTGKIPSTLVNLTNLEILSLHRNNFNTAPTEVLETKDEIQKYLATLRPSRPPAPPPSPRTTRALYLPGWSQSPSLAMSRTSSLSKKLSRDHSISLVYAQAPHAVPHRDVEGADNPDAYCWFYYTDEPSCDTTRMFLPNRYAGYIESAQSLAYQFESSGCSGIVAFSQGSVMADILCVMAEEGVEPWSSKLRYVVFMGGFPARLEGGNWDSVRRKVPSLHFIGAEDTRVPPERQRDLHGMYDGAEVFEILKGKHAVPGFMKAAIRVGDFILSKAGRGDGSDAVP